jgi:hypothetical protein
MVLLQAAMGYGMLLLLLLGFLIVVGIPVFMLLFMSILGKMTGKEDRPNTSKKRKLQLIALSLFFSIIAAGLVFFIIIILADTLIDWSSS